MSAALRLGSRTWWVVLAALGQLSLLHAESLVCSFANRNGNPLRGVESRLTALSSESENSESTQFAKTDNKGLLSFHDIRAGRYLLEAQLKGYFPLAMHVDVPSENILSRVLLRDRELRRAESEAVKSLEAAEYRSASDAFESLVAHYPLDASLRDNFARALAGALRRERALTEASLAARIDPAFRSTEIDVLRILHRIAGEKALQEYDFEGAIANFEALQRADPRSRDGFFGLALAYGHMGRLAEALAALDQALQIAPNDEDLLRVKRKLEDSAAK